MNIHYKDIILPIILKYAPNAQVILYGSRARGTNSEGADIDIALDAGEKLEKAFVFLNTVN